VQAPSGRTVRTDSNNGSVAALPEGLAMSETIAVMPTEAERDRALSAPVAALSCVDQVRKLSKASRWRVEPAINCS
jgi:hypothetical protein